MLAGRLVTADADPRDETGGAGGGEANGGEGAPLADAGQRRTRWSFVIPPLGGRGLFSWPGRGPEAGRPPSSLVSRAS